MNPSTNRPTWFSPSAAGRALCGGNGQSPIPTWMLKARNQGIGIAALSWILLLTLAVAGVCGCTTFTLVSVIAVAAATFGIGNGAFGALTSEREKKTLDSLRLTQLTANEVLARKLMPELWTLGVMLLFTLPPVAVAGWMGGVGLGPVVGVALAATLGGVFAAVSAIFLSSLFATTSQAVVAGWILKLAWLLGTPLLDMVVGAVFVQHVSPPVFSALNPFAAVGVLAVPEGAEGMRAWLPALFPWVTMGAVAFMWWIAARRYESGMVSNGGLRDREVHRVYRKGWGPAALGRMFPVLRENPAFLRELAAQVRSGAGRWPGYLVFIVLFLAPTFYARSWSLNEMGRAHLEGQRQRISVEAPSTELQQALQNDTGKPDVPRVAMRTWGGTQVVLEGHKPTMCLRMFLFQTAGIPLPKDKLRFYQTSYTAPEGDDPQPSITRVERPDTSTATALGLEDPSADPAEISDANRAAVNQSSLHVGLAGAIALFLLYLCIRYSAFMATAVTGERSRRTWEDLALSGISPQELMKGKLAGAVILPWMQMTLAFPVLLLFVASGNLGVFEIAGLYIYAVALTSTAGVLGLWASATSVSSHDAHLKALGVVLLSFFVLPFGIVVLAPMLVAAAVVAMLLAAVQGRATALSWAAVAGALALAPHAASPLTAAVSFMPSLTTTQSFLTLLGAAPSSGVTAVLNLVCGLVLTVSLARIMWTATATRLAQGTEDAGLASNHAA